MFALHQRTRRRICQAGFGLLCALPTTGLLAWTVSLKTPRHLAHCQRELTERLGLGCRFQQVRYPQPGESLYEGLELVDAETGQWVLRCGMLYATRAGRKLVLAANDVELAAERGERLLRLLMRRLTRELPGDEAIWLVPGSVTLVGIAGSQTYDDVECRVESQPDKSTATLRFRLPEAEAGEPPVFTIVRRHIGDSDATAVTLDTLGAELPISIFKPLLNLQPMLGDDAALKGKLSLEASGGRWSGRLSGNLTEVDLERLIARRFPHHFAGRAEVEVDRARFEGSKLIEASGRIHSEAGTVGGSLLVAAVELLDCQPGAAPLGHLPFTSGDNYRYHDLALDFAVNEHGLRLTAPRDAKVAGALVLNERDVAMLLESRSGMLPLIQLVKALVPDSTVQVPATKETAALVPWLPLPPIVRAPDDDRAFSAPPLRVNAD